MLTRKSDQRPPKRSQRRTRMAAMPRRRRLLVFPALLVSGLIFAAFSFGSVSTDSGFEAADGNLASGSLTDWNSFSPLTWTGTAPYRVAVKNNGWSFKGFEDAAVSATDTGYAGGVKQDHDCGTTKASKAPNKDDLKRIYIATKSINGRVFLVLGWVRIPQNSVSASAHVGYEFNQGGNGTCGGTPALLKRKGGDMLVVYDFEGGSDAPAIKLSRWLTSTYNPTNATCEVNSNSPAFGCWGATQELTALVPPFAEGKVNLATVTDALKPAGADPGPVEFGEAGIDLTGAGVFSATQCAAFGSVQAISRSSGQSSQAAMMDIVGPGAFMVSNCGSVSVTKNADDGGSQAGAQFTLYPGADTSGTAIDTCTVQADGTCTPTFANLQPGEYTLAESSVPEGYTADPDLPYTFTLAAGENLTIPFTNEAAPGTVKITKLDDADDPVAGATFTLYSPQGISNGAPTGSAVGSCETVADGTCTISGVDPGNYTIDESVVPAGYAKDSSFPKNITVDNGEDVELDATDPRKFKAIVLVCRQYDSTLYPSNIKINGDTRPDSLSSAQAAAAGLDESKLCALTQGAKSGLLISDNDQLGLITIP